MADVSEAKNLNSQIIYLKWGYPPLVLDPEEHTSLWQIDRRDVEVKLIDGSIASISQGSVAAVITPPTAPGQ